MTQNKDDYELCLRAEGVELPSEGYFGVSAATGGLAGKIHFCFSCLLVNSITVAATCMVN